jgi:hypothetical protein
MPLLYGLNNKTINREFHWISGFTFENPERNIPLTLHISPSLSLNDCDTRAKVAPTSGCFGVPKNPETKRGTGVVAGPSYLCAPNHHERSIYAQHSTR